MTEDAEREVRRILEEYARRLVQVSWTIASLLEDLKFLNTHYIGIIRKRR